MGYITTKNLFTLSGIIKCVELFFSFVVLVLTRAGGPLPTATYYYIPWGDPYRENNPPNVNILGDVIAFGYFIIILVQFIALFTKNQTTPHLQNCLLMLIGGLCCLSAAAMHIAFWSGGGTSGVQKRHTALATGAMAVLFGLVMLVDAAVSLYVLVRDDLDRIQNKRYEYDNRRRDLA